MNAIVPISLSFTRFDVREMASVAPIFRGCSALTGIYILEFENGQRYVGQSTNVVTRVGTHRRRYPDLQFLHFAPCSAEELDEAERQVIAQQEIQFGLRNKLLTKLPHGEHEASFTVREEETFFLPEERERRRRIVDSAEPKRTKYWELGRLEEFGVIVTLMAEYVDQTIPDALATSGLLWTVSALPSTNRRKGYRRLLTLNCGNMESLVIDEERNEGGSFVGGFLNLPEEQLASEKIKEIEAMDGVLAINRPSYRQRRDIIAPYFGDLDALSQLLSDTDVLEAAYRLNVGLMRQGSTMYRRFHNSYLAEAIVNTLGAYGGLEPRIVDGAQDGRTGGHGLRDVS
ncbi:GIY-YIG nuclease family protein [Rothia uropygioeca]|uniref:GIY-YIG nuclease family protein n=1 Tax=Kocuria sp. 257 TaxID=2021970 RepID=UPI0010137496|nr:GIY-YIG nuclease family protein [Kocuria sp. 257]